MIGRYLVSVGSVDGTNIKSGFSSFGSEVELVAPGENVMTLAPGGVMRRTGTSFAAPMASGALALVLGEGRLRTGSRYKRSGGNRRPQHLRQKPELLAGMLGNGTLDVSAFVKKALRR